MNEDEILQYADIKKDGSILLGNHTVCDGANYGRKIGVFTHIHRDHTLLLKKAMQCCSQIYVSPPTFEMLSAMEQSSSYVSDMCIMDGRHINALDYNKPQRPKLNKFSSNSDYGDAVTLYQSHHILGSAQVLVETMDGTRIVYSGDFGKNAKPIPCDILVLDSTHGSPMFDGPVDPPSLERRLVEYVDAEIQNSRNILVRAHRGRLQYTMHLLHKSLPEQIRFLAHSNDIKLIPTYKKYGMDVRDCIRYDSPEGKDVKDSNSLYVEFRTHGSAKNPLEGTDKMAVFNLGGKILGGGTTIKKNGAYNLEFMDHADYSSILQYVQNTKAEYVVTDYIRGRQGQNLADAIQNIGINAIARPMDVA